MVVASDLGVLCPWTKLTTPNQSGIYYPTSQKAFTSDFDARRLRWCECQCNLVTHACNRSILTDQFQHDQLCCEEQNCKRREVVIALPFEP